MGSADLADLARLLAAQLHVFTSIPFRRTAGMGTSLRRCQPQAKARPYRTSRTQNLDPGVGRALQMAAPRYPLPRRLPLTAAYPYHHRRHQLQAPGLR